MTKRNRNSCKTSYHMVHGLKCYGGIYTLYFALRAFAIRTFWGALVPHIIVLGLRPCVIFLIESSSWEVFLPWYLFVFLAYFCLSRLLYSFFISLFLPDISISFLIICLDRIILPLCYGIIWRQSETDVFGM